MALWRLSFALAVVTAVMPVPAQIQPVQPQENSAPPKYAQTDIARMREKAEAGDPTAQFMLGNAYLVGSGVARNNEIAFRWLQKAAEQGNDEAQNQLGILYRTGQGVERSKEEAVKWYRKAASHKNAQAMFNLGAAYYNGDGVPVDDISAYAWFLAGSDAGNQASREAAARSESELKDYQRLDSYTRLAEMYQARVELPQDFAASAKWYRKAADAGSLSARIQLATMMLSGHGVPQNFSQARADCEEAAKHGYPPGAF